MADSRMGEEEAYCNQKLEEMIKEVRKNVSVTWPNRQTSTKP